MEARDFVVGLSAIFLLWVGAIVYASSRLVSRNWHLYRNWRTCDRDTRIKMAMWLAIPMLMVGIMWQRSVALYAISTDAWTTNFGIYSSGAYLVLALCSLALLLFWAFDRTYGGKRGDTLWCRLMWSGLALGAGATFLNWRF